MGPIFGFENLSFEILSASINQKLNLFAETDKLLLKNHVAIKKIMKLIEKIWKTTVISSQWLWFGFASIWLTLNTYKTPKFKCQNLII